MVEFYNTALFPKILSVLFKHSWSIEIKLSTTVVDFLQHQLDFIQLWPLPKALSKDTLLLQKVELGRGREGRALLRSRERPFFSTFYTPWPLSFCLYIPWRHIVEGQKVLVFIYTTFFVLFLCHG